MLDANELLIRKIYADSNQLFNQIIENNDCNNIENLIELEYENYTDYEKKYYLEILYKKFLNINNNQEIINCIKNKIKYMMNK